MDIADYAKNRHNNEVMTLKDWAFGSLAGTVDLHGSQLEERTVTDPSSDWRLVGTDLQEAMRSAKADLPDAEIDEDDLELVEG